MPRPDFPAQTKAGKTCNSFEHALAHSSERFLSKYLFTGCIPRTVQNGSERFWPMCGFLCALSWLQARPQRSKASAQQKIAAMKENLGIPEEGPAFPFEHPHWPSGGYCRAKLGDKAGEFNDRELDKLDIECEKLRATWPKISRSMIYGPQSSKYTWTLT